MQATRIDPLLCRDADFRQPQQHTPTNEPLSFEIALSALRVRFPEVGSTPRGPRTTRPKPIAHEVAPQRSNVRGDAVCWSER